MSTDKFRKKPVVIEAIKLPEKGDFDTDEFLAWAEEKNFINWNSDRDEGLEIHTLEGVMRAEPGDWIIRGVKGEFYPCKPDIFAATYEPADSSPRYEFDAPALIIAQKIMECRATAAVDGWPDVRLKAAIQCLVIEAMKWVDPAATDDALTAADYEEVLKDHRRLVRELDVLINGEKAAQQASLCDIVGQVRREGLKASPAPDMSKCVLVGAEWIDVNTYRILPPEGWKLVPIEPTPEMCETRHVGVDPYTGMATDGEYYSIGGQDAAKVYRAMLAAAPAPGGEHG